MNWKSFQLKLISFLDEKNCKRLFILCFCMSALTLGFHNSHKNQNVFSSKADPTDLIELKGNLEQEDITNNPTSTSLKK